MRVGMISRDKKAEKMLTRISSEVGYTTISFLNKDPDSHLSFKINKMCSITYLQAFT